MKTAALKYGFSFVAIPRMQDLTAFFKIFKKGHSRKAYNLLRGNKEGKELLIFDYDYVTGGGKNRTVHKQTIAEVKMQGTALPKFILGKENFFHKIGDVLGFKDIDFNTNKVFSDKFLLKGAPENGIRNIFNSNVLYYFENQDSDINVEGHLDRIIYYKAGRRIKPNEITPFMQKSLEIANLFDRGNHDF